MYKNLLVPVDGSAHARKALQVACQLVGHQQAVIYILNVPELPPASDPLGIAMGATNMSLTMAELQKAGEDMYQQFEDYHRSGLELIERLKESVSMAQVEMKPLIRIGAPAKIILEEASTLQVEAIVMGSRGLSDLKSLVVGSVSHKVMHAAGCTVITVHWPGHDD